jgi:hypothetical protein
MISRPKKKDEPSWSESRPKCVPAAKKSLAEPYGQASPCCAVGSTTVVTQRLDAAQGAGGPRRPIDLHAQRQLHYHQLLPRICFLFSFLFVGSRLQ